MGDQARTDDEISDRGCHRHLQQDAAGSRRRQTLRDRRAHGRLGARASSSPAPPPPSSPRWQTDKGRQAFDADRRRASCGQIMSVRVLSFLAFGARPFRSQAARVPPARLHARARSLARGQRHRRDASPDAVPSLCPKLRRRAPRRALSISTQTSASPISAISSPSASPSTTRRWWAIRRTVQDDGERERSASTGSSTSPPPAFGRRATGSPGSWKHDFNSTSSSNGTGDINRSEQINLSVPAVVTDVLPNGNLVIKGSQEVRVNFELRQLTIAGIVRPSDISAATIWWPTTASRRRASPTEAADASPRRSSPDGASRFTTSSNPTERRPALWRTPRRR